MDSGRNSMTESLKCMLDLSIGGKKAGKVIDRRKAKDFF